MIHTMRNLQIRLEDNLINFYQNLLEREQFKVVFTLPQFQNHSFLHAINRSLNVSNNTSVSQELTNNSFTEQCIPPLATSPNVTFSPQRTSSPKSKGTSSENFMPQAARNIDTTIKESMARNSLEGDEYDSSSKSKSSAKIKAKFDIFLCRKSEIDTELEELLSSEKDDSVQPATLKLRATDLKA